MLGAGEAVGAGRTLAGEADRHGHHAISEVAQAGIGERHVQCERFDGGRLVGSVRSGQLRMRVKQVARVLYGLHHAEKLTHHVECVAILEPAEKGR
ncbi:hypothetical protein [Streptomyces sp. NPDC058548]|uniref:hypothetical protein n=1 Tax=Streptomyces sp. NPDC058548 TaxID=3346545 RepID=UPI00364ED8C6